MLCDGEIVGEIFSNWMTKFRNCSDILCVILFIDQ